MTIVMILLIAAFALWGVGDYLNQSSNDTLATVNEETISYADYTNQFASYRQSMMAQFGEGFDPSYFDSPVLKRNYLESMINNELVRQVAMDNGYVATADEIRDTLEQAPAFQNVDGQFDKNLYAAFLSRTNQSAQVLQQKIAEEQAGQVLGSVFNQSSFVTSFETRKMAQLNKQTRSIEYITVSPSQFMESIEVSDEELNAYYDENSSQYMTNEEVSVNYIELKAEDVAGNIEIDEAVALTYFEDNEKAYTNPEQRKASHILVNDDDDAENTLIEIKTKLDEGMAFEELAETYSQDPGSAAQGGDLGWVSPGDMVEEFDEALFAMETGTVSDAVESQFGFHIIQLNEIKAPTTKVYEEVKTDIIQALQAEQAETLFLDKANDLAEAVLDAQSGLEQVAESLGYELKTTEFFPRSGGVDVAANPDFMQSAYSENVKENLMNSDVINLSDTHVVFIHMNEVKAAELKPIEDVKESIVSTLKTEKANNEARSLAENMKSEINESEKSLTDVAVENDLEVISEEAVTRTGSSLPFNLVKGVFELSRPSDQNNNVHILEGNGSDVAVVRLNAVNEADLEVLEDISTEAVQLARNIKNNEQQLLIQALRESADITVNEDLLNQSNL